MNYTHEMEGTVGMTEKDAWAERRNSIALDSARAAIFVVAAIWIK